MTRIAVTLEGKTVHVPLNPSMTIAMVASLAIARLGRVPPELPRVHLELIATRTGSAASLNVDTRPMPATIEAGITLEWRR